MKMNFRRIAASAIASMTLASGAFFPFFSHQFDFSRFNRIFNENHSFSRQSYQNTQNETQNHRTYARANRQDSDRADQSNISAPGSSTNPATSTGTSVASTAATPVISAAVGESSTTPIVDTAIPTTSPASTSVQQGSTPSIFETGAVTLTFDDDIQSQYDNALPIMRTAGMPGTFYIISQQILDNQFAGYMSKAEIQQLYSFGEEIAAHTRTHPHLPDLPREQQQQEIAGSRQDLLSWDVGPIHSFSYPYGSFSTGTINLVKDSGFTNAVGISDGGVTLGTDPFVLPRFTVENTTSPADIEKAIDDAIINKQWLILSFHYIDTGNDQYSITPANFQQVIDYLKQKGVPVITVAQGIQAL